MGFAQAFFNHGLFQAREAVEKQFAVQVVDFMLDAGGEQPVAIECLRRAVIVKVAHATAFRTADFFVDAGTGVLLAGTRVGHREAPFRIGVLLLGEVEEFRIDEVAGLRFLAVSGEVHDGDAQMDADLHGGESDASGVIHGFQHVVHEGAGGGVHLGHRFGAAVQERIGEGEDFADGHGFICSGNAAMLARGISTQGE